MFPFSLVINFNVYCFGVWLKKKSANKSYRRNVPQPEKNTVQIPNPQEKFPLKGFENTTRHLPQQQMNIFAKSQRFCIWYEYLLYYSFLLVYIFVLNTIKGIPWLLVFMN